MFWKPWCQRRTPLGLARSPSLTVGLRPKRTQRSCRDRVIHDLKLATRSSGTSSIPLPAPRRLLLLTQFHTCLERCEHLLLLWSVGPNRASYHECGLVAASALETQTHVR